MGDSENVQQASRKRGALKELSRDNPGLDDEEDSAGLESGTFKKASDEVLASRRIVRVKRKEPSATPVATSNPFAGIRLVPATAPLPESKLAPAEAVVEDQKAIDDTEEDDEVDSKKVDVKDSTGEETEKVKDEVKSVSVVTNINNAVEGTDETEVPLEKDSGGGDETKGKDNEGEESKEADKNGDKNGGLSSFQQHSSSKNAFTGLAGTESSGSSFSFSVAVSQDGSTGSGSLFGYGSSIIKKSEGASAFPAKGDVSTETGEENEKVAFSADSVMFEYLDGGWKERGKGVLKVNVSSNGKGRLVMRTKGNYRLILNASLYPEMKLASMEKKGITFACMNSIGEGEGKEGLSTFAVKFKDPVIVEEFRVAVDKHKDVKPVETTASLKTPENSPTATDA